MKRSILICVFILTAAGCSLQEYKGYRPPNFDGGPFIGGAKVYGNLAGTDLLYTVAAIGDKPMQFKARGLPRGLEFDKDTGIITGAVKRAGVYNVRVSAENVKGRSDEVMHFVIGDQLSLTPPMGWMSWNQFGPNISEELLKQIADAIVESGMRDAGYQYIFIDDHWHGKRDEEGFIQPHPEKFPNGIGPVADYVHSKGLKLGIYSDAAEHTCGGEVGSYGYEQKDAQSYASWGIDYLKYDYCGAPADRANAIKRYTTMSEALKTTGRTIMFGVCEWGQRQPWLWAKDSGGQLWRTTWDIRDTWDHGRYDSGHAGIVTILEKQVGLEKYAGPGGWNDPDMLVVGLNGRGLSSSHDGANGCTATEYQSNMSLWCLLAAPLYASCDVRNMDDATREILTNVEAIAINQDVLGVQASRVYVKDNIQIWAKPLLGGDIAVGLLNTGDEETKITAAWHVLGVKSDCKVRDLWEHRDLGVFNESISMQVASHETKLLRLSPILE